MADTVDPGLLSLAGERALPGKRKTRIVDAFAEMSKNKNKPMVVATWEMADGTDAGVEAKTYHSCNVTHKNGRVNAFGIAEVHAILIAYGYPKGLNQFTDMGVPLPEPGIEYAERLAAIMKRALSNKIVILDIREEETSWESQNDQGIMETVTGTRNNVRVDRKPNLAVAAHAVAAVPTTANLDPLANL